MVAEQLRLVHFLGRPRQAILVRAIDVSFLCTCLCIVISKDTKYGGLGNPGNPFPSP